MISMRSDVLCFVTQSLYPPVIDSIVHFRKRIASQNVVITDTEAAVVPVSKEIGMLL